MRTVTSVEAQHRFGELLDSAQRERVVSDFESFFAAADTRIKPEARELSDESVQRMVDELR